MTPTLSPTKEAVTCGNDNDCDVLTDGDYICKYPKRCRPRKVTSAKYEKCGVCVLDDSDYCTQSDQEEDFLSFSKRGTQTPNICDMCLCGVETKGGRDCEDVITQWNAITDLFKDRLDEVFASWCPALLTTGEESFAPAGETFPALLNAEGEQCKLENVRPKCTSDFDYCGCEALICNSNSAYIPNCDEVNTSDAHAIGYFVGLAVMMVASMWM